MPNKFQKSNPKSLNFLVLSFVWFAAAGVLILPLATHAQTFQILPTCNPVPGSSTSCGVQHLLELLVNIYNFMLGLAALVALLFIIWGGLRMLYFSYLEDSSSELAAAKLTVRRAVAGFAIVALAYLIVSTTLALVGIDTTTPVGKLLIDFGLLQ